MRWYSAGWDGAERQVLQLPLYRPDSKAIGQRRIQLLDLQRDLAPSRRGLLARMADTHQLFGQSRHHQARIADHGQQHLAQGLGLRRGQRLAG